MENKNYFEQENVKLRIKYDMGLVSSEEFFSKSMNTEKADILKKAIMNEILNQNNNIELTE